MRTFILCLGSGVLLAVTAPASAAVIAAWDFQTTANGGTAAIAAPSSGVPNTTPKVYAANFGSGALYLDGSNFSSNFSLPATGSSGAEIGALAGTTVNANASIGMSTVTAGAAALSVAGGTLSGGVYPANGKSMVLKFSMSGLAGLSISYATQRSGTGFTSQVLQYSTDGSAWFGIGANSAIQSDYGATAPGVAATSFSGISGLDNASVAYVRITLSGATSSAGNNRFDNIVLAATVIPAPGPLALLGMACTIRPRRRR